MQCRYGSEFSIRYLALPSYFVYEEMFLVPRVILSTYEIKFSPKWHQLDRKILPCNQIRKSQQTEQIDQREYL